GAAWAVSRRASAVARVILWEARRGARWTIGARSADFAATENATGSTRGARAVGRAFDATERHVARLWCLAALAADASRSTRKRQSGRTASTAGSQSSDHAKTHRDRAEHRS